MGDKLERLETGFRAGLLETRELIEELPDDVDAFTIGFEAARAALAPVAWAKAVGARIQTAQAIEILGISPQALQKKVQSRTLIGLPGKRTMHFPTWQFDFELGRIRPSVERILRIFRRSGEFDPYMISAWMVTPCDDLDQATPAQLLEGKEVANEVFELAKAVAKRWAQ